MDSEVVRRAIVGLHIRYKRIVYGMSTRYGHLTNLIVKHRMQTIMEIGTWNGYRALEMIEAALMHSPPHEVSYYGFDLFENATRDQIVKEIGKIPPSRDQVLSLLGEVVQEGVKVQLFKGDTKTILPTVVDQLPKMDLIFIDGGHSHETVKSDWHNVQQLMIEGTVVVFDDFVNDAACRYEGYGVNRVIEEIDPDIYRVEVLKPMDIFFKPWGVMVTRFVRIELRDKQG